MAESVSQEHQRFYSQHGEDFLLSKLFAGRADGFFVEVGCIDGRRYSNTLHFEEIGWHGICVEAHSGYIESLSTNRPGSIIEHAAVGARDEERVTFYANSRGSLSTLDGSRESEFETDYGRFFTGFEPQDVSMLTLSTIFKKHGVQEIDLLSLDIEGSEVLALRGLDLTAFRPRVLVIESESIIHQVWVDSILLPAGYHLIAILCGNLFYSLDVAHRAIIGSHLFQQVSIVHAKHPLDSGFDRIVALNVATAPCGCRQAIKRVASSALSFAMRCVCRPRQRR